MICGFPDLFLGNTRNDIGEPFSLEGNAECIQQLIVLALFYLQVDIGHFCCIGYTGINDYHLPAHLPLAGERTRGGRSSILTCGGDGRVPGCIPRR